MSLPPSVPSKQEIEKIIFENFNDTDVRFSNDQIMEHLSQNEKYRQANLDVLDIEDILLEMERTNLLRPIAQNFNTRYFKLQAQLELMKCKECNFDSYHSGVEESRHCPQCKSTQLIKQI